MMTFCINPTSANGQCRNSEEVCRVVRSLVDCFQYLLPALNKKRARVIYDRTLEQRELECGQNFWASLNRLAGAYGGRDTMKRWLFYTRNRAERPAAERVITVVVSSRGLGLEQINGVINECLIEENSGWLSLGGHRLAESHQLRVQTELRGTFLVENAHNLDTFKILLPRYKPSAKHRRDPYYDSKGQKVSCMPLDEAQAQYLLLVSIVIADDRWAFHEGRGKCYRFVVTGANLYHGFEVEDAEVETGIWKRLQAAGIIPKTVLNS